MSGQTVCFLTPSLAFQRRCRAVVLFFSSVLVLLRFHVGVSLWTCLTTHFPELYLEFHYCEANDAHPYRLSLHLPHYLFHWCPLYMHYEVTSRFQKPDTPKLNASPPNHSTIQTHAMLSAIWACRGIVNTTYFHDKTCLLLILFASKQTPCYPSVMTQGYNK